MLKIRHRTLINSGLSIGISSEGIEEEGKRDNSDLSDVISLLVELV